LQAEVVVGATLQAVAVQVDLELQLEEHLLLLH
jgi:hypothetical protein